MRRTYRSKRDSENCLDRKDVLLATDEKKSVFNAFYIQKIKQAKRELSSVGSTSQYNPSSNKIRRSRYVKRLVKNVASVAEETIVGPSFTQSTFLTPDKSIHVNKEPDLFDQLLNASLKQTESSNTNKDDLFDKILPDRVKNTYCTRKVSQIRKYNYSSSDSTDSEKENTKLQTSNTSQNVSDIKTHQLFIEAEIKNKQGNCDDSINKVENNFSFFNNIKPHRSNTHSLVKTFKRNQNRLTKNLQSPVLQNSPISSTPFTEKYRSKSIYKFSPIPVGDLDESRRDTIVEENKDNMIALINNKEISPVPNLVQDELSPVTHLKRNENKCLVKTKALIDAININPQSDSKEDDEMPDEKCFVDKTMPNIEKSSLQLTEVVPLLGISYNSLVESNENNHVCPSDQEDKDSLLYLGTDATMPSQPFLGFTKVENLINESSENDINQNSFNSVQSNCHESSDQDTSEFESIDRDSMYDSCNSEHSSKEKRVEKTPVVKIVKMDESLFQKYYKKMIDHVSTNNNDTDSSINSNNNSINSKDSLQFYSDQSSNKESDEESSNKNSTDSSDSREDSESYSNSNDEEKCYNFITTRRGNEITNDTIISVMDDSSLLSSECDNTVLNNTDASLHINNNNQDFKEEIVSNNVTVESDGTCSITSRNSKRETLKNSSESSEIEASTSNNTIRKSARLYNESMNRNSEITDKRVSNVTPRKSLRIMERMSRVSTRDSITDIKSGIVLQPGKKWERSLSIYRRITMMTDHFDHSLLEDEPLTNKGRKYRQSVIHTMEMQECRAGSLQHNDSFNCRRSTFFAKPCRSTIKIVKESNSSRISLCNTTIFDDLKGFVNEDCDDTIVGLSNLSIADSEHEVTVLEKVHDTSTRAVGPRDYVLRRCNQTDAILFDECYPDTALKHCRKIGEGVYGEVFLWRAGDGRARVMKIVPIAGTIKVNGEHQKDYHEIISEIVIAMELSALRAPIADIERHIDEGQDIDALDLHSIENATDVFNEVLAVRCVCGSYPSRLLDLWDLYDEVKGSENDNPAILPSDQQYIVLELANAGQDLESYEFNSAEQAHALFLQVAFGLAVGEEAYQFEHRDLHWGNVLIAASELKYATFVLRGRVYRVQRRGVAATVIDYSLSRLSLPLAAATGPAGDHAALYNDLAADEGLFTAVGDHQFEVYRLMRDKLANDWNAFEPYTNVLWLHYTLDKMITALRYKRTNTKIHKHYISKLKGIKNRILDYGSAAQFVLTDNEF